VGAGVVAALGAVMVAGCGGGLAPRSPAAPVSPLRLRLAPVASGLSAPVQAVTLASQPGRIYVVEQTGRVLVREGGRTATFLDLRHLVSRGGERGLLALAFHPDHARNGRLFVHFTDRRGDTRVAELRRAGRGAPRLVRTLLRVDQPYPNHNGGALLFGPDRLLYLGLGDGGGAFDPEGRSQDRTSRLGKLLRVDVDAAGAEPAWQTVAYGLRNPWRASFDRAGRLFIGDVGQDRWEEVDVLDPVRDGLANLGWRSYEGFERRDLRPPSGTGRPVQPVYVYGHDRGCSITGGVVVAAGGPPALRGRYLFGDYCAGTVWSLRLRPGRAAEVRREPVRVPGLTSIDGGARGEVFLTSGAGAVYRLEVAPGG
jgi:glucose/arabinose dehydrogenase